ncbi:hypothetical protein [uncultured Methanosphaera sp.]|uniref:hypothetical protein n=1 Tax=uncultured Methanosphaera sp. TaxID=262501 RepID=UPI000DC3F2DD|nr:hypothetical protein [uncultured Methanosphaera sp.]RAP44085.1 MAG: hypothetical protein BZ134_04605 [Methanosphaera sp. SHI1033]
MTDNALGKGLDALIKKPAKESKPRKSKKSSTKRQSSENIMDNRFLTLSDDKLNEIKEEVEKNPRISLWSPKSAACLRYLKKTTPEFSISSEASIILEEAIADKYPEIWKLFEDL